MKIGWRGVFGILLSAGFLYFAFRGIRVDEVMTHMRRTNVGLMVLAAVLATGVFPLRAIRWRPILDPIAPNLPFRVTRAAKIPELDFETPAHTTTAPPEPSATAAS